jgi:hypothetical protein
MTGHGWTGWWRPPNADEHAAGDTGVATPVHIPSPTRPDELVTVSFAGAEYQARRHARGAAYELFAEAPGDGFEPDPRTDRAGPYHRFVPAVETDQPTLNDDGDTPSLLPASRLLSWYHVQRLSQTPHLRDAERELLRQVRGSIRIRPGTRMVRLLTRGQVAATLRRGLPLRGFCYREYDVAHLRTPAALRPLAASVPDEVDPTVVYLLRWRAVGPGDYLATDGPDFAAAARLPASSRVGPPILGTGFAPSDHELIPEYATEGFADLPLPMRAEIIACTDPGDQVTLFEYLPEQDGWSRMVGSHRSQLLAGLPGIDPAQERHPVGNPGTSRLIGRYKDADHDAIADPPRDYRVRVRTRAARFPVETLARHTPVGRYQNVAVTVVDEHRHLLRLRSRRLDDAVVRLPGVECVERGVYEFWAPAEAVTDREDHVVAHDLPKRPG